MCEATSELVFLAVLISMTTRRDADREVTLTADDLEEAALWAVAQGWRPRGMAPVQADSDRKTMPPMGVASPAPTGASPQP